MTFKRILEILKNNVKEVRTTVLGVLTILVTLGVRFDLIKLEGETTVIITSLSLIAGSLLVLFYGQTKQK